MSGQLLPKIVFCTLTANFLISCTYVQSQSQDITFGELPTSVQLYMQDNYANNEIVAIEREKHRFTSQYTYAVNFMDEGQEWEVELDKNGTVTDFGREDD